MTLVIPTVISQLVVLVYNMGDTWYIGQTGDLYQVVAVTVTYPIFMLVLNMVIDPVFIFLMGMGVTGAALSTCLSNTVLLRFMSAYPVDTISGMGVMQKVESIPFGQLWESQTVCHW